MLEECVELTPPTRWSKAMTMFEEDERFKALEREKDRRNIFEDHVSELKEKERVEALEDRKRNIIEYQRFLESCNFIKPNSQWRKVQDRLEVDERCSRLEKIDQLEIFQEYLRDLEREEEEKKKIQKEELKKAERKHRDEFRGLIEEHIATGELTAKTIWRDYLMKVKDLPVYSAIASNSSGATPKDLFEDAVEDLKKRVAFSVLTVEMNSSSGFWGVRIAEAAAAVVDSDLADAAAKNLLPTNRKRTAPKRSSTQKSTIPRKKKKIRTHRRYRTESNFTATVTATENGKPSLNVFPRVTTGRGKGGKGLGKGGAKRHRKWSHLRRD
ncbi:unnamed protein product [Arabidopsis halleri]